MTPDEIQKDREMPSTSWAVWAWQAYRDGALVDPATLTAENAALKERVAELEADIAWHKGDAISRAKLVFAPEDGAVATLCERYGYGAVMDSAMRLWIRKDEFGGAFYIGGCLGRSTGEKP